MTVEAIVPCRTGFVAAGEILGGNPLGSDMARRDFDPSTVMAVWISDDGVNWERVRHDEQVFGGVGRHEVFSIAALDDRLVIVGFDEEGPAAGSNDDITVWTSSDGRTWRQDRSFGAGEVMFDVVGTADGLVSRLEFH